MYRAESEEGEESVAAEKGGRVDQENAMEPVVDELTGKFLCKLCGAVRSSRKSYNSHRQQKHGTVRNTLVCPVDEKCMKSPSADALRRHLQECHGAKDSKLQQNFPSQVEFLRWKEDLQTTTQSLFVQWTGPSEKGTVVYYCCRAGERRSLEKGLEHGVGNEKTTTRRGPRAKGSEKINAHCPAVISAKYLASGVVQVTAYLQHIGHNEDICFIALSNMVREKVKQKLCEGFAPDRIAEYIRKDQDSTVRDRHLKTKDILYMLRHDLPQLIGYHHEDDHISVDMAVQKFAELGDSSPVFHYRPRTAENDTFALGMQTATQRRLLDEFGSNVVCLDTTHKTCCYDGYLLGTVLVLDSVGSGQPVAFFLIKGESEVEITPILASLKERHPNLHPKIFMSDMAEAFWNAWKAVFNIDGVTRLFCLWHVMSSNVYAITDKKKNTRSFGDYFDKEYVVNGRCQLWARFGRLGSDITTNMHLESFHRTLKQRYLKRMCNRRVDYVMHVLITKVAPDFANQLDRAITMRGTSSTFQQRVKRDHGNAKYLLDQADKIKEVEIGRKWTVQSEAAEERQYEVEVKDNYEPDHNCLIRCQFCQVCPHRYVCGCPHFQFRCAPMPCKHIHGVHTLFSASGRSVELDEDDDIGSPFEPPPIDLDYAMGNDPTNASEPVNSGQATDSGNSANPGESANPHDGAHDEAAQRVKLIDQLRGKKATIVQQMQVWETLIKESASNEQLEDALSTADRLQKILQASIDEMRPSYPVLTLGPLNRKRKMSPQKTSSAKILPLPKRPKKSTSLSAAEKEKIKSAQERLSGLEIVIPLCSICHYDLDSQQQVPQLCNSCTKFYHLSCDHVCLK
uniref:SWIM-type domain-containing protein n=1 Tax=Plectus sambesii TaxID=2011161 RepID=A0A914XFZ5_9BILA